ncbi:hypothetical protein PFISCL1PPCAC_3803, partial [Pristionchus fissidentatus]
SPLHDHVRIRVVRVEQNHLCLTQLQLRKLLVNVRNVATVDYRLEDYLEFDSLLHSLHFISECVSELLIAAHFRTN